ncbi:hypothetical protein EXS54_03075 [Patescibacteria group bacterium]|nr:hypothetical protein [Patescibacteria group bacterium]
MSELVFKQTNFEGPLDLLLQLIEDEELDITTVALAEVTDQYLGHVKELSRESLPQISDYLVIAARLVLIKSRAILPTDEVEEEEADDLAAQLMEYKKVKELAAKLGEGIHNSGLSVGKAPDKLPLPEEPVFDGIDIEGLHKAFVEILDRLPEVPDLPESTLEEQVTMEECIELVQVSLRRGPVAFRQLFEPARGRTRMIVTFLAVLELIKQSSLTVNNEQKELTLVGV